MAATEEERKTDYECRFCKTPLRRYGDPKQGYLKCMNKDCPDPDKNDKGSAFTMQYESDYCEYCNGLLAYEVDWDCYECTKCERVYVNP